MILVFQALKYVSIYTTIDTNKYILIHWGTSCAHQMAAAHPPLQVTINVNCTLSLEHFLLNTAHRFIPSTKRNRVTYSACLYFKPFMRDLFLSLSIFFFILWSIHKAAIYVKVSEKWQTSTRNMATDFKSWERCSEMAHLKRQKMCLNTTQRLLNCVLASAQHFKLGLSLRLKSHGEAVHSFWEQSVATH